MCLQSAVEGLIAGLRLQVATAVSHLYHTRARTLMTRVHTTPRTVSMSFHTQRGRNNVGTCMCSDLAGLRSRCSSCGSARRLCWGRSCGGAWRRGQAGSGGLRRSGGCGCRRVVTQQRNEPRQQLIVGRATNNLHSLLILHTKCGDSAAVAFCSIYTPWRHCMPTVEDLRCGACCSPVGPQASRAAAALAAGRRWPPRP